MDEGRTQTNGPDRKKANDNVEGLTYEIWHRIYASRKEGGRGLISTEDCVDASIQAVEDNIKNIKEILITVTRNISDSMKVIRIAKTTKLNLIL